MATKDGPPNKYFALLDVKVGDHQTSCGELVGVSYGRASHQQLIFAEVLLFVSNNAPKNV